MAVDTPVRSATRLPGAAARTARAHPVAAAASIYALLSLCFLAPGLLPERTISGSDLLWTSAPWAASKPDDVRAFGANGELVDPVTVFQPFLQYSRDRLPDAPLWNPYVMAGRPYLANMQSALLSPFSLPAYVLPFWWSLSLIGALKLFTAAFGTFLLGRELGMRFGGALLAGVVFGFGLFFVVWLPWPLTSVWALLPWLLFATERLVRRPGLLPGAGLAALVALQFFGGHPESSFHVLFMTVGFFVLRAAQLRRVESPARLLAWFAGALALGAALAAAVIVPFLELVSQSGDLERRDEAAALHVLPKYLFAGVLSDWWGRPTQTPIEGYEVERAFYAGALPLLLAFAALLRPTAQRAALAAFGALMLAVVVGVPLIFDIVTALPGFGSSYNTRLTVLALMCVALLAGWGLDDLSAGRLRGRRARLLLGAGTVLLLGPLMYAVVSQDGLLSSLGEGLEVALALGHPPPNAELAAAIPVVRAASGLVWLAFAGAALGLVALRLRGRVAAAVFAAFAVGLVAADLFRAGMGQNPAITTAQAQQPTTGAIRYLQSRRPGRFAGALPKLGGLPIPPDVSMRYGLYDARGYDYPVQRRYDRAWRRHVAPPAFFHPANQVLVTTPRSLRVLSLLGVRDIIQAPGDPPLGGPGLRVAYDRADARVYANDRALPRVWLADSQRVVDGEDAALDAIAQPGLDLRRTVITEQGLPGLAATAPGSPSGAARLTRYDPERVVARVRATRPAELVLSDVHYPGWKATVDGRDVPVDRVDYLLRGVRVPAGEHTVALRYRPASWTLGWVVSLVALAGLAAAVAAGLRRRRSAG